MKIEFKDSLMNHRSQLLKQSLWCVFLPLIPFVLIKIIYMYFFYRNSKYLITEDRFQHETGILSKQINNLEMWRVNDAQFTQTMLQRMFNEATIVLITQDATGSVKLIEGFKTQEAKQVFEQILTTVRNQRNNKNVLQVSV